MKKLLLTTSILALLAANASAKDAIEPGSIYVQGNLGYGFKAEHKFTAATGEGSISGHGFAGSAALGYRVYKKLRFDAELYMDGGFPSKVFVIDVPAQATSFGTKVKVKSKGAFLNAYCDLVNESKFTPFFGGGIGYMQSETTFALSNANLTREIKEKKSHIAWKGAAGISYSFTNNLSGLVQYQYINKNFKGNGYKVHSTAHTGILGIRYGF